MIMAAGTGGHVFPGIAIAKELEKQGVEVSWLGSVVGMEKEWVSQAQIPFRAINIKGLRGNGLLGWLIAPINIARAVFQASRIMKQEKPDLVLGMGGFVCGPGGISAKLLGKTLVLHEQNSIPGLTNKLLSKIADLVITAFPQQQIKSAIQIGNPVREGLEQIPILEQTNKEINLLVIGGSRGALALNKTMPKALKLLEKSLPERALKVVHQTGVKTLLESKQFYTQAGLDLFGGSYQVVPFIDDMIKAYRQADLVICRSGALTVSELIASARPAIMIPYPHAVDDHQTANAQVLVSLGGGEIIQQTDLTPERLQNAISNWFKGDKLEKSSSSIQRKSIKNATFNITKELTQLM
jgi:UDP-N-acetylglucosamine--N-acetylmuramyl-(pentapeptide) pyrophosphoryl-undecaprenol N-acetylglucosamine transferase